MRAPSWLVVIGALMLAACAVQPRTPVAIIEAPVPLPTETSHALDPQPRQPDGPAHDPFVQTDLVRYRGPVEHIFFHPLMVHPKVALHGSQGLGFNEFFVTVLEFQRMLPQLYARDWVLVDINSLVREVRTPHGTELRKAPLMLPRGKKPLVISIDDLNYYPYMLENRLNSRLVLDDGGNVAAEYETDSGRAVVSRDTEIVPILDQFVETHPDFSFQGAKGVIALTGYDGILGYRTSGDLADHPAQAQRAVAPIVERLKATGWTFASHSYGHPDVAKASDGYIQVDTDDWQRNVEPLIGPTQVYIYPFGAPAVPGTNKFEILRHAGFRIFCPIAPVARLDVSKDYAIMDRVHIDGISLLTQQSTLERFFDPETVADDVRPPL